MLGDAFDDMPQISLRIEPVQFSRADEAVDCGGSLTAGVRTGEEIVFSPEGYCPQRAFGCIVVYFDGAVGGEARERLPARHRIASRHREFGFCRDLREEFLEPTIQRIEQRTGSGLADFTPDIGALAPDRGFDPVQLGDSLEGGIR